MKNRDRKVIIKYISIVSGILVLVLAGVLSIRALAGSKVSDIVDETEEVSVKDLQFPDEADYLFVGNSLTHFNNTPLMFRYMVNAGEESKPEVVLCSYSARDLDTHSKAIEAAVASHGDEAYLEKNPALKDYFWKIRGKTYDPDVFHGYCERLLKADGTPKHFSNIVLQMSYKDGFGDVDADTTARAIERVMNAMQSEDTQYIVVATMGQWHDSLKQFVKDQNTIDKIVETAAETAGGSSAPHKGDVKVSYYGRSLCNYLLMSGLDYAQHEEPEAYEVYTDGNKPDLISNDVMIGDGIHPTQLGSYIATAALYTLMYDSDPQDTIKGFRGGSSYAIRVDDRWLTGKCCRAIYYNYGQGFVEDPVLLAAAEAAYKTQAEGLRLKRSAASKDKK